MKSINPTKILYNSTNSIFNKITDINDLYNLNCYVCSRKGRYIASHSYLANLITKKQHTNYCFVPCRKENHSYHLIFDFDNKSDYIFNNKDKFIDIVNSFIKHIINAINLISNNSDTSYIFAVKKFNSDPNFNNLSDYSFNPTYNNGVHLYFPNIIVNSELHLVIYQIAFNSFLLENSYNLSKDNLKKIIDDVVVKGNFMRLFYFHFYDNKNNIINYYYPVSSLSTFIFDSNPTINISHSFCVSLNTPNLILNNNYEQYRDLYVNSKVVFKSTPKTKNIKKIKKNISNNSNSNSDSDNESNNESNNTSDKKYIKSIIDYKFDSDNDKLSFFTSLTNILTDKYYNDYNKWIKIIFLLKNYNLYDLAISFSQKSSSKFDNNSINIINNIFNSNCIFLNNNLQPKTPEITQNIENNINSLETKIINEKTQQKYLKSNSDSDCDIQPIINEQKLTQKPIITTHNNTTIVSHSKNCVITFKNCNPSIFNKKTKN